MRNILVTDDSRSVQAFVARCLKGKPYTLTQASDGLVALEILGKDSAAFDLMLLDWEMPKMDGPSTFAELRARNILLPVLMMTSRNSTEDLGRMLNAGVSEYLMKPFTSDILIEKLEVVFHEHDRIAS